MTGDATPPSAARVRRDQPLTLRPVREADLGYFDGWIDDPDLGPFDFFGFRRPDGPARRLTENGMLADEHGTLLVVTGGEVLGDVGWFAVPYGGGGRVLNIGIRLLPAHRGKGYGARAQRMLADYLFATYPVNRVEAGTDVDNVAEQRALERAGFRREGVARGAQWRAGGWHDLAIYSRLRADP